MQRKYEDFMNSRTQGTECFYYEHSCVIQYHHNRFWFNGKAHINLNEAELDAFEAVYNIKVDLADIYDCMHEMMMKDRSS